jgi:hypothetical protein
VGTVVHILHQADSIGELANEPIGVFKYPTKSFYRFIWDYHMTNMLQFGCKLAYPHPAHYLCQHIYHLVSHSNCITAAVYLWLDKHDLDDNITFRLCWNHTSIPLYLGECWQDIGCKTLLP